MSRDTGCLVYTFAVLIPIFIYAASQDVWLALGVLIIIFILGLAGYYQHKYNVKARERLLQSGINEIDRMTGLQFEQYLVLLFAKLGYSVTLTKASGDFGADLVISKNEKTIVVQAKRYIGNIGVKAIQEVYGSKQYYNASEAWVITNSFFTNAAKQLAFVNGVELIDRNRLIEMILSTKENPQ